MTMTKTRYFRSVIIIITMILANSLFSRSHAAAPDFAFPEKVEKSAEADLKAALKASDGKGVVNAMIRLGLARSIVNTDSIGAFIEKLEGITAREKDPLTKSLLNALEARIYVQLYDADSWTYDRRETVADSGNDYRKWSAGQFLNKVMDLTSGSLKDAEALQQSPLNDYVGIVDINHENLRFYPTLFDFIAGVGIANLKEFAPPHRMKILSPLLITDPTNPALRPGPTCRPMAMILGLYSALIRFHADRPAPLFQQQVSVRDFVRYHVYNPDEYNSGEGNSVWSLYLDEVLRLYKDNCDSEFAGLFLCAADEGDSGDRARELYRLLNEYQEQFPGSFLKPNINNALKELTKTSADIQLPAQVAPGRPIKIKVNARNARKIAIQLNKLPDNADLSRSEVWPSSGNQGVMVDTAVVRLDNEIPYITDVETSLTFPDYGLYIIKLTVDGKQSSGSQQVIRCSDLTLSTLSVGESQSAWVINALDGNPVAGAELFFTPWSRRQGKSALKGVTDALGEKELAVTEYGFISAAKGDDKFAPSVSILTQYNYAERKSEGIDIFTSLGLYRPGDDVEFALVAYNTDNNGRTPLSDARIGVTLRDVNYQSVDTIFLVTDSWGRAEGKFTLPTAGLTGQFSLSAAKVTGSDKVLNYIGSHYFTVSDYKLPTFEVTKVAVNRPATYADSASVIGKAVTYSGFPVSDAQVKASLTVQQGFWWWKTTSTVFFTTETVTDADGQFTVDIPAQAISSAPSRNGIFVCNIEVTSADGETRTMTATFNMGKPLGIIPSIPAVINVARQFKASVEARDANGDPRPLDLIYTVMRDSVRVAEGKIPTGSVTSVISNLPTGVYSLEFAPVDTALADPARPCEITVYRPMDKVCPVDSHLWIPESSIVADPAGSFSIITGSAADNAVARVIVTSYPGKIVNKRWVNLKRGMQSITGKIPAGEESVRVLVQSVKDFKAESYEVAVKSNTARKSVTLEIETFRDKVIPGQDEKITLRVKPVGGADAASAVMLDMANKAIDVLAPNNLRLSKFSDASWSVSYDGLRFYSRSYNAHSNIKYSDAYTIIPPKFQFYGLSFGTVGRYMMSKFSIRGSRSMATNGSADMVVEDKAMMAEADYDEAAVETMAAPAAAGMAADAGSVSSEEPKESDDSYRPSEIPLAFFRPMLTTGEDGTLEITYTVPDANTTWILRALAYNKELLASSAEVEIVSSKPVMVSQNAPRFLRAGDSMTLSASIMNDTDTTREVKVISEILSADGLTLLYKNEEELTLPAKGSAVTSVSVNAPVGQTGLIYRVRAMSGDYTDGEQSLLPILPSEQDVVESEIFYLAPGQNSFTISLPAVSDDDRVYLNFTENPAWQVVSALPGLRDNSINSSVEASAALFSAAVAEGLMREYPEVARVLRRWVETNDPALISELEKNSELKSMLLSATPWVSEALSDTERMQRLALLFDRRETSKVIASAIDRLAMMRADGGWSWSDRYPVVSRWATEVILEELGQLKRMGYLPSDQRLNKMIKETVAYLDKETAREFARYPRGDYWLYVMIRDNFTDIPLSTAASRVVEAQVQKALADWKNASVAMKGVYALMLNNHGYNASARQILQSLREFSTSTPEKGMWWQQLDRYSTLWSFDRVAITSVILDAFNAVEPGCDDVEKIRQWLILNKTNNDWGNAVMTTQTVASILTSGKPLKVNPRGTAIHVGDTLILPENQEYATGEFTEQITSLLSRPETLTIDRQADYPSVGGVVMMRRLPMDSIAAVGCREITVAKSMMVFDGEQWIPRNEFKVGDRVRVELTLNVEDDLSYVVIEDLRAAGLEPVEQLPRPIAAEGLWFYRENRDSSTNIFIDFMPRGVYRLAYELFAAQSGDFLSGVAQVQSQYNPIVLAHSAGQTVKIVSVK